MDERAIELCTMAMSHMANTHTSTYSALGREWDWLPDVFGGPGSPGNLFTEWLPFDNVSSFLEVGSGTGITAVMAALSGCPHVTATDVNPVAVRNTAMNAERHGVGDRVRSLESDLFAAVSGETFDMIYCNPPHVHAEPDHTNVSGLDIGAFDPGYRFHEAFIAEVEKFLAPSGRVFMGFSYKMGNADALQDFADTAGLGLTVYRQKVMTFPNPLGERYGEGPTLDVDITLLELTR